MMDMVDAPWPLLAVDEGKAVERDGATAENSGLRGGMQPGFPRIHFRKSMRP